MLAKDIMTTSPITVASDTSVREIAKRLLQFRISAVPVTTPERQVVGIVSEGDLMRRPDTGTERHPSWWLALVTSPEDKAVAYIRSHGGRAEDVMTRTIISVNETASLAEIAGLLESHRIKRVPVLHDGKLVGIVSRADLIRALATLPPAAVPSGDSHITRSAVEAELRAAGVRTEYMNILIANSVVDIWGAARSKEELKAAEVAARVVKGVTDVKSHLSIMPDIVQSTLGAE